VIRLIDAIKGEQSEKAYNDIYSRLGHDLKGSTLIKVNNKVIDRMSFMVGANMIQSTIRPLRLSFELPLKCQRASHKASTVEDGIMKEFTLSLLMPGPLGINFDKDKHLKCFRFLNVISGSQSEKPCEHAESKVGKLKGATLLKVNDVLVKNVPYQETLMMLSAEERPIHLLFEKMVTKEQQVEVKVSEFTIPILLPRSIGLDLDINYDKKVIKFIEYIKGGQTEDACMNAFMRVGNLRNSTLIKINDVLLSTVTMDESKDLLHSMVRPMFLTFQKRVPTNVRTSTNFISTPHSPIAAAVLSAAAATAMKSNSNARGSITNGGNTRSSTRGSIVAKKRGSIVNKNRGSIIKSRSSTTSSMTQKNKKSMELIASGGVGSFEVNNLKGQSLINVATSSPTKKDKKEIVGIENEEEIEKYFDIIIHEPGSLGLNLDVNTERQRIRYAGYAKNGQSALICEKLISIHGDVVGSKLRKINDIQIDKIKFDETISMLKSMNRPMKLIFEKPPSMANKASTKNNNNVAQPPTPKENEFVIPILLPRSIGLDLKLENDTNKVLLMNVIPGSQTEEFCRRAASKHGPLMKSRLCKINDIDITTTNNKKNEEKKEGGEGQEVMDSAKITKMLQSSERPLYLTFMKPIKPSTKSRSIIKSIDNGTNNDNANGADRSPSMDNSPSFSASSSVTSIVQFIASQKLKRRTPTNISGEGSRNFPTSLPPAIRVEIFNADGTINDNFFLLQIEKRGSLGLNLDINKEKDVIRLIDTIKGGQSEEAYKELCMKEQEKEEIEAQAQISVKNNNEEDEEKVEHKRKVTLKNSKLIRINDTWLDMIGIDGGINLLKSWRRPLKLYFQKEIKTKPSTLKSSTTTTISTSESKTASIPKELPKDVAKELVKDEKEEEEDTKNLNNKTVFMITIHKPGSFGLNLDVNKNRKSIFLVNAVKDGQSEDIYKELLLKYGKKLNGACLIKVNDINVLDLDSNETVNLLKSDKRPLYLSFEVSKQTPKQTPSSSSGSSSSSLKSSFGSVVNKKMTQKTFTILIEKKGSMGLNLDINKEKNKIRFINAIPGEQSEKIVQSLIAKLGLLVGSDLIKINDIELDTISMNERIELLKSQNRPKLLTFQKKLSKAMEKVIGNSINIKKQFSFIINKPGSLGLNLDVNKEKDYIRLVDAIKGGQSEINYNECSIKMGGNLTGSILIKINDIILNNISFDDRILLLKSKERPMILYFEKKLSPNKEKNSSSSSTSVSSKKDKEGKKEDTKYVQIPKEFVLTLYQSRSIGLDFEVDRNLGILFFKKAVEGGQAVESCEKAQKRFGKNEPLKGSKLIKINDTKLNNNKNNNVEETLEETLSLIQNKIRPIKLTFEKYITISETKYMTLEREWNEAIIYEADEIMKNIQEGILSVSECGKIVEEAIDRREYSSRQAYEIWSLLKVKVTQYRNGQTDNVLTTPRSPHIDLKNDDEHNDEKKEEQEQKHQQHEENDDDRNEFKTDREEVHQSREMILSKKKESMFAETIRLEKILANMLQEEDELIRFNARLREQQRQGKLALKEKEIKERNEKQRVLELEQERKIKEELEEQKKREKEIKISQDLEKEAKEAKEKEVKEKEEKLVSISNGFNKINSCMNKHFLRNSFMSFLNKTNQISDIIRKKELKLIKLRIVLLNKTEGMLLLSFRLWFVKSLKIKEANNLKTEINAMRNVIVAETEEKAKKAIDEAILATKNELQSKLNLEIIQATKKTENDTWIEANVIIDQAQVRCSEAEDKARKAEEKVNEYSLIVEEAKQNEKIALKKIGELLHEKAIEEENLKLKHEKELEELRNQLGPELKERNKSNEEEEQIKSDDEFDMDVLLSQNEQPDHHESNGGDNSNSLSINSKPMEGQTIQELTNSGISNSLKSESNHTIPTNTIMTTPLKKQDDQINQSNDNDESNDEGTIPAITQYQQHSPGGNLASPGANDEATLPGNTLVRQVEEEISSSDEEIGFKQLAKQQQQVQQTRKPSKTISSDLSDSNQRKPKQEDSKILGSVSYDFNHQKKHNNNNAKTSDMIGAVSSSIKAISSLQRSDRIVTTLPRKRPPRASRFREGQQVGGVGGEKVLPPPPKLGTFRERLRERNARKEREQSQS